jgi:hypothetical protein
MSHHRVALVVATALLVVLAGCGGSSGSTSTPTSSPTASPSNQEVAPNSTLNKKADIDADRLQRRHVSYLEDADSYAVRMTIQTEQGRNTDIQVTVRRHEDRVGALTEIETEQLVSEVWRPADSEAVYLKQGDSVTYVGPDSEAQVRQPAIRDQSIALFVDQLARRDLQPARETTVRGTDALVVTGNASVVPGDALHESNTVRDVEVTGTITDDSLIDTAEVRYVRSSAAGDPTVTRTYEVTSLNQGLSEPDWVYNAPRVSTEMVNERVIRLRNTGARAIPVGSRVFVQLDDTVLRLELPTAVAPEEMIRLYRPAPTSDAEQNSTSLPPLRVSTSSVEFDELEPFGDRVTVTVRVGDDAARVEAF